MPSDAPRYPLTDLHLAHGAIAADYRWEERLWDWMCVPCGKVATKEHLCTAYHKDRISWYGANTESLSIIPKSQPTSANTQSLSIIPMSPPAFCKQHGEVDNMYRYQSESWVWHCIVCGCAATEAHCSSDRHLKNVFFRFNQYRIEGMPQRVLPPINSETWRRQATALGLDIGLLMGCFGARPEIQQRPHALEFSNGASLPTLGQVESFWGDKVYVFIRQVLQELTASGTNLKDLFYFYGQAPHWRNVLVWSDADKETSKQAVVSGEVGIWWPAVAVLGQCGTIWWTYCQAFALQRSKKAWEAHIDRVKICRAAPRGGAPPPPPVPSQRHSTTHSTVEIESASSASDDALSGPSEVESVASASDDVSTVSTGTDFCFVHVSNSSDHSRSSEGNDTATFSRRNRWTRSRRE